jgi:hypothetical protein
VAQAFAVSRQKFVAQAFRPAFVHRRAVVDHDTTFDALARRVFARFGTRPICMPRVGRREVRVRSPRRAPR